MTQAPINAQNTCAAYPPYSGKDPLWDEFWPTELKDLPPSNYIQQEGVVSKVSDELISCCKWTTLTMMTVNTHIPLVEKICHAIHYLDGNRDPAAIRTLVTDYRERAGSAKCDLDRILRLAVSRGRLSIVKQLVKEHGANLNQSDNLGRTAIFYLAVEDDLDVAEYTIARTCQDSGERTLDHRDSSDRTVLWYATRWGAGNTVTLLLSRGVCPTLSAEPFGLIQDRDDILSTLSFSKLVQLEPDMPIIFCQAGPERSYCNTSSITEFQRSSNWWSERSVYYLGTQSPDSLLWLHFPSANVSWHVPTLNISVLHWYRET